MAENRDFDVVVAGGGPVGCTLSLALAGSRVSIARIGGESSAADRPIALSHGSRLILERLGAWKQIPATPIETIHVSQQHGFGRTVMRSAEHGLPALGYVTAYAEVLAALAAWTPAITATLKDWKADDKGIDLRLTRGGEDVRMRTRLLVLAEGGATLGNERVSDYNQHAVTAEVATGQAHRGIAWERFTAEGPLALLPFRDRYAVVWSVRPASAAGLLGLADAEFLARLRETFGGRLGEFVSAGPRAGFPLALRCNTINPAARTVAVGNAAQTLHPVAGQGLNLGLRDAWELAQMLLETPSEEIGAGRFVSRYARRRRLDRYAGIGVTDFLVRAFSSSFAPLAAARGAGLALLDVLPPARRFLARRMIFGARALP
ncbi:MAG: FAD-dependent monooxygenase [Burkholderiales bacterium]